jgi:DNA polymerase III delta prime subunit
MIPCFLENASVHIRRASEIASTLLSLKDMEEFYLNLIELERIIQIVRKEIRGASAFQQYLVLRNEQLEKKKR